MKCPKYKKIIFQLLLLGGITLAFPLALLLSAYSVYKSTPKRERGSFPHFCYTTVKIYWKVYKTEQGMTAQRKAIAIHRKMLKENAKLEVPKTNREL